MVQIEVRAKMSQIGFELEGTVTQYPYRTATVHDRFMEMRRDSDSTEIYEMLTNLEIQLSEAAGANRDNHVVYGATTAAGKSIYFEFTDSFVYFGLSIVVRRW